MPPNLLIKITDLNREIRSIILSHTRMPNPTDFQSSALATLRIEQQAIDVLATQIDDRFNRACEVLLQCKGRVVITGMGKSGHIGRKMAAHLPLQVRRLSLCILVKRAMAI